MGIKPATTGTPARARHHLLSHPPACGSQMGSATTCPGGRSRAPENPAFGWLQCPALGSKLRLHHQKLQLRCQIGTPWQGRSSPCSGPSDPRKHRVLSGPPFRAGSGSRLRARSFSRPLPRPVPADDAWSSCDPSFSAPMSSSEQMFAECLLHARPSRGQSPPA